MRDNDPADLEGDGKFDAIDISILEGDRPPNYKKKMSGGCCVIIITLGATFSAGLWYGLHHFLA
jgi:hypothetical protein